MFRFQRERVKVSRMSRRFAIGFGLIATAIGFLGIAATGSEPAAVADLIGTAIPTEQALALEDGLVSDQEHADAFDGFLGCLERNGVEVVSAELRVLGESVATKSNLSEAESDVIVQTCRETHYRAIALVYRAAHQPTADQARLIDSLTFDCLQEGHAVPDDLDFNGAVETFGADAAECRRAAEAAVLESPH